MRLKQSLTNKNDANRLKAIDAHAGFVSYVVGKVQKIGIEKVLQEYAPALGSPTEFYWLKKAFERVLDFAEQVQLKQMPQKLQGAGENGEFVLKIEIDNENKATPLPRSRIAEYIEV